MLYNPVNPVSIDQFSKLMERFDSIEIKLRQLDTINSSVKQLTGRLDKQIPTQNSFEVLTMSQNGRSEDVFDRPLQKENLREGCYVPTQLFLACTCVYLFLVSPVAIFRTGFPFVEYCSGSFRPCL